MFGRIVIIIAVIGFCDVYLVVLSAKYLTIFGAIGLCLLTAFLGGILLKKEGFRVLFEFQKELSEGKLPIDKIADGVLILIGGALLMTPGFITDIIGFLFLIPIFRKVFKPILINYAKKNIAFKIHSAGFGTAKPFTTGAGGVNSNEKEADIIDIK